MTNQWEEMRADEYCDDVRDGTHDSPKQVSNGYKLLTSKHIGDGVLQIESAYFISEADYNQINKRSKVNKNDVLISMIGTVGRVCRVADEPDFAIKNMGLFKVSDVLKSKYLYYYLRSRDARDYISSTVAGSTQKYISLGSLRAFPIRFPTDERVMRRLVYVLDALDCKIMLNNQINDYLADLASMLYREFCTHASGQMGTLADLVELRKDSTKAGKHPELPYMPIDVIPMKSMGVSEFRPNDEAKSSLQLFQRDDIVIGAMRVYFHRVVLAPCEGITRNTCFVLRPKTQLLREYALLTCFQPEAIEYANVRSKGSTMPYAVWENSFETYPVLIPNESELEEFSRRLSPVIDRLRDSYKTSVCLSEMRDALLPKLMSGEIDVSQIDLTQLNNHLDDC